MGGSYYQAPNYCYVPGAAGVYPSQWVDDETGLTGYTQSEVQSKVNAYYAAQRTAAEKAEADRLAALQVSIEQAAREAEQLRMQKELLESRTAIFVNPETYNAQVQETNTEIQQYNTQVVPKLTAELEGYLQNNVELPKNEQTITKAVSDSATDTAKTIADVATKSAMLPLAIAAGVLIAIYIFLFRRS
jgi:hypothetical protein